MMNIVQKVMTEFVGLRSKLYSFRVQGDQKDRKQTKGIKRSTLQAVTIFFSKSCEVSMPHW